MRVLLVPFVLVGLAGCATSPAPEPITKTVQVQVPVAVPCSPKLDPAPALPDTPDAVRAIPRGDLYRLVQLLLAGREIRDAYIAEQAAALNGCRGTAP